MLHTSIVRSLFFALAYLASIALGVAGFNQFVGFGDSTLDSGYFRYNTTGAPAGDQMVAAAIAAGARGGYAGPGTMVSTLLASRFDLSAEPIGNGGTNYANGGAHTVVDAPGHVSAVQQIDTYLASVGGAANPNGLYIVSTGNNDWIYTLQQGPAWVAANPNYLIGLTDALVTKVAALHAAGARTIIVPNSFTYAMLPAPSPAFPPLNAGDHQRLMAFNAAVWSGLTKAGVNFIPADMDSVFRYVIQHPGAFGFTAESVLAKNAPSKTSALLTTPAMLSPEQDRTFLFIDGAHLTTAGQRIEADYMHSLLAAPSLLALVAESAVQNGFARTAALQTHIAGSQTTRSGHALNLWLGSWANAIRLKNETGLPEISAKAFGGMVGADFRIAGGTLAGAAIMSGGQRQHFSTGGHLDAFDGTLALYLSRTSGAWWGDAVATAGFQRNEITREVALGILTDQNRGDANGRTLGLALRGGHDFRFGRVRSGPFAGVDLQQVHLNGFTETGSTQVTALSFGDQTRRSSIGQLGWRAGIELGSVLLSARGEWDHDWSTRTREVTATLTTVAAAPYRTDAPAIAKDWATVVVGAALRISPRSALCAEAGAVLGNPQVNRYQGALSLRISL